MSTPRCLSWIDDDTLFVGLPDQFAHINVNTLSVEYFKYPGTLPRSGESVLATKEYGSHFAVTRQGK